MRLRSRKPFAVAASAGGGRTYRRERRKLPSPPDSTGRGRREAQAPPHSKRLRLFHSDPSLPPVRRGEPARQRSSPRQHAIASFVGPTDRRHA
ncbi:hypothetical protein FA09DRAFT_327989 [Tilletiopsis washingtonensis]|uniref:Uncharacterized protein n=1 Tax=Tilletiopsis washingtonensis TaxID=58919 RepID=A0A316ZI23_9BASI|nr:hypothetical protein FA09DRAFT_327989 [Tilletiopsis washingtonensis]PWO00573.1 hypothetical protein FA09DRAFT_327989 [Tilletiopsis washingtonensis]